MSETTLARSLGQYAVDLQYSALPDDVAWTAKRMTLDTLGCAVAAFNGEPVRIARALAGDIQSRKRSATILGTNDKSSLEMATFVNVTMARYLDLNDYKPKPGGHPSDNILTSLTVADCARSSGADFLLSVVLAYEVQGAFGEATRFKDREWGWDYTNNVLMASALIASRLLGLSPEQAANAVSIAVNAHVSMLQVRSGEISLWKAGSSGEAARCGVFSALLAAEGMTGPTEIFEGEYGYFKKVMGTDKLTIDDLGRDGAYSISSTRIKLYPANGSTQPGICAAIAAKAKLPGVDEIDRIEITTNARTLKGSGSGAEKWAPKTHETADHSLPYVVAMGLMDGNVSPASYAEDRLRDPATLGLMSKMTVAEDPEFTAQFPAKSVTALRIHLKSGEIVSEKVDYPKGHPALPVTDAEIEQKFRGLTEGTLSTSKADKIIDYVWTLDKQPDLRPLIELCVVG